MKILHFNTSFYTWLGIVKSSKCEHTDCGGDYEKAINHLKLNKTDLIIIEQTKGLAWQKLRMINHLKSDAKVILLYRRHNKLLNLMMSNVFNAFFLIHMKAPINLLTSSLNGIYNNEISGVTSKFSISRKEFSILTYLSRVKSARLISSMLGVSFKTVYVHKYNIIKKSESLSIREFNRDLSEI